MTLAARFQVFFAWRPLRAVAKLPDGGFDFTGRWYWWRRVRAVNNQSHGWIVFEEDQTPEKLSRCPSCGQHLADS